jgi:hypothetical protein
MRHKGSTTNRNLERKGSGLINGSPSFFAASLKAPEKERVNRRENKDSCLELLYDCSGSQPQPPIVTIFIFVLPYNGLLSLCNPAIIRTVETRKYARTRIPNADWTILLFEDMEQPTVKLSSCFAPVVDTSRTV